MTPLLHWFAAYPIRIAAAWAILAALISLGIGRAIEIADRRGQLDDDQPDDVAQVHRLAAGLRGDK